MDPRDPRDPRHPGSDQPPGDTGWNAPLRPPDEELTERYGQPAPEPAWEKPPKPFSRERFLLLLVAWILGVQFSLLILAGLICGYGQYLKFSKIGTGVEVPTACPTILDKIKESAGESLAVLLALLGGGTVAVGEYQRRQYNNDDPRNPRP
jgi:hypothetical protein